MTYEQQVKLWSQTVKKSVKKVLSSRKSTSTFMRKTGVVAKGGKSLAKPYR